MHRNYASLAGAAAAAGRSSFIAEGPTFFPFLPAHEHRKAGIDDHALFPLSPRFLLIAAIAFLCAAAPLLLSAAFTAGFLRASPPLTAAFLAGVLDSLGDTGGLVL